MLRLNPRYRPQVPHGLAIIGALLLLAGTLTGVGNSFESSRLEAAASSSFVPGGETESVESPSDSVEAVPAAPLKQKKRFKINLFLFRH